MYRQKKSLKSFLNLSAFDETMFSRSTMTTIIRALLEPVANQNTPSLIFTRFKNIEGVNSLIKRLEYCSNVEIVDTTSPNTLIKDDYVELEFIIFTSARYNFALLFDYSKDKEKNYTKAYFLVNSRKVNDVFDALQNNLSSNYNDKFYTYRPERRENELLNEGLFNVFKKLNNSIEESAYKIENDFIVDLSEEDNLDEKIKIVSHEIKNQLSVLDIYSSIIEKQTGKNKNTEVIKRAISNIKAQLAGLKNFENTEIKEIEILDVIESAASTMKEVLEQNKNKIITDLKPGGKVFADENKLISVIINILKNSNESSKNNEIIINTTENNGFVFINITNHGDIIKNPDKIFEKGFTTKEKGTGIGLFACKNYLAQFKGDISLLKSTKEETTFQIKLPLAF